MFNQQGFNYTFAFDKANCQQAAKLKKEQKDTTKPLLIRGNLSSVEEKATIFLPEINIDKAECGRCFVQIPVLQANSTDFVAVYQKRNARFLMPGNFFVNEVSLVRNENFGNAVKRWMIPFKTTPIAFSEDGTMIYVDLQIKELDELVLLIFADGIFQFHARADIDETQKGSFVKDVPKEHVLPITHYMSFGEAEKRRVLRFNTPCN
jgi:hypothetical protein